MGNEIWSIYNDNSDGKASLKRQKSPETTTDTQGMSKFLLILRVKYSYFEIFIVINRPYFVPLVSILGQASHVGNRLSSGS